MQQKTKTKMCQYCGEEPAKVRIPEPSGILGASPWDVCYICDKVIKAQQKLSSGAVLAQSGDSTHARRIGQIMVRKSQEELEYLSKESGKPIFSTSINIRKTRELNKIKDAVTNRFCVDCGKSVATKDVKYCDKCLLLIKTKKANTTPTNNNRYRKNGLIFRLVTLIRGVW